MKTESQKPLWIHIEEEIQQVDHTDLEGDRREATVHKIAANLDEKGLNVSRTASKLLQLRAAVDARIAVGHPLLTDLQQAFEGLTLDDVAETRGAAVKIERELAETWPVLRGADYIQGIEESVVATKLTLIMNEAKGRSLKDGIRYLHDHDIASDLILEGLGIDQAKLDEVNAELEAEMAELKRVRDLLGAVEDKEADEKIRHLLNNDVTDELITQVAQVEQTAIDAVKDTMKREIEEKERLAAEEAARKEAEAAGPSLESIPDDEMLEFIESIREILEFSDVEDEIRTMCDQSSIPKCLVDIAVSEPDKLDELEAKAEG